MKNETYKLFPRRNQYGEYVVKCYRGGKQYPDGDYFTDDLDDAKATLQVLLSKSEENNATDD